VIYNISEKKNIFEDGNYNTKNLNALEWHFEMWSWPLNDIDLQGQSLKVQEYFFCNN
jgi:hypothetical protein